MTNDVLKHRADLAQLQDSDYAALRNARDLLVKCANNVRPLADQIDMFLESERQREEWRKEVLREQQDHADS